MSGKLAINLKRLFVTLAVALSFAYLAYLLGWSSFLTVKEVKIEGTSATSLLLTELKAQGVEPVVGQKLARVDIRSISRTLDNLDWLSSSDASRDWLNRRVKITVLERVAVAKALTEKNRMVNFDGSGVVFEPISKTQQQGQDLLPLVSTAGDAKVDLVNVALLIREIPAELDYLLTELDQISVTKAGFLLMTTRINNQSVRINWGSIDQIGQKFSVLQALLKLPENQAIKQVDLSEPSAPIVK